MVPAKVRAALVAREIDCDDVLATLAVPRPNEPRERGSGSPASNGSTHPVDLSGATASWYSATGHAPFLENPDRFNKEPSRFVHDTLDGSRS